MSSGSSLHDLRAVLMDSSAFYALFDRQDRNHRRMVDTFEQLATEGIPTILTNHVRAETHALLLNRLGRYVADRFIAQIDASPPGTLLYTTRDDEEHALALLARYQDKHWSLVDCISFVVMERLGIQHALTLDHNFEQYGFQLL